MSRGKAPSSGLTSYSDEFQLGILNSTISRVFLGCALPNRCSRRTKTVYEVVVLNFILIKINVFIYLHYYGKPQLKFPLPGKVN